MEKYYHILLTEDSEWVITLSCSLTHAMVKLTGSYEAMPYMHFDTYYENYD